MPQAAQGGLLAPPLPSPEMAQSMEQACFLWVRREEGVHSIVSNYLLSRSPREGAHPPQCQGTPAYLRERESASVPSPGGLGQVTGFGPWNLSCQLKLEETPFLPLCRKDAMIHTRAGPRPMNGLSEKSHKQMKREQGVNLLLWASEMLGNLSPRPPAEKAVQLTPWTKSLPSPTRPAHSCQVDVPSPFFQDLPCPH